MSPEVISAKSEDNFLLRLEFEGNQIRIFDVKPYLNLTVYKPLKNIALFSNPLVKYGTIVWGIEEDIDFCPDTLWLESKPI
jgi:hypothetical protein